MNLSTIFFPWLYYMKLKILSVIISVAQLSNFTQTSRWLSCHHSYFSYRGKFINLCYNKIQSKFILSLLDIIQGNSIWAGRRASPSFPLSPIIFLGPEKSTFWLPSGIKIMFQKTVLPIWYFLTIRLKSIWWTKIIGTWSRNFTLLIKSRNNNANGFKDPWKLQRFLWTCIDSLHTGPSQ